MYNASHYNQLLGSALISDMHSSCLPITIDESRYLQECAHIREHEIWQCEQEYMGAHITSPPPAIFPEDLDLFDYPPMQLPPATPFLSGTPLPNLDIAFDLPLAESYLPSWEVPKTCPSMHQKPHVHVSHHNVHDKSGHNDAREHFSAGSRCAESSIPTNQSWSNGRCSTEEEPTPSPANSPSPNVDQLKGKRSSSHKKLKGARTKSSKQPSKPKPRALKKKKLANNPKPTASSNWSSDGIEGADASTKPQLINGQVYGSKNLVSERKRRIKLNDKLLSLRALVPKISKMDKASIVADAIDYVKDLHKQLKSTHDDILALQAGTYVPTQEDLSSHASEGVDAQPHKQVNIPQHKIVEMHVSNVEPTMYQLRIHCKREQGVLLQLVKALEALNLKIVSANLTTVINLVINTIIIKGADEVSNAEDFKELLKKTFPTYGLHF